MPLAYFTFYKIIIVSILFAYSASLEGQNSEVEIENYRSQMERVLSSEIEDSVKFLMIIDSINNIDAFESKLPLDYLQKGIKLATEKKLWNWRGNLLEKLGFLYRNINKKDSSEILIELALEDFITTGDSPNIIRMHLNLIAMYASNDAAEKSIQHAYNAISIYQALNDENGIGRVYLLMAGTYINFNEPDRADEFITKALDVFEKSGNTKGTISGYDMIGKNRSNDPMKSLHYINKAIDIKKQNPNLYGSSIIHSLLIRLRIHSAIGRYDNVEKDLIQIHKLAGNDKSRGLMQELDYLHAANLHNQKRYNESNKQFQEIINDPLVKTNPYNSNIFLELNYKGLQKWDSAYYYHMQEHELDIIQKMHESKMNMEAVEAKYESEKKKITIATQNELIKQQKMIQYFAWGSSLLLIILLLQTIRSNRARKASNKKLLQLDNLRTKLYTNITHEFRTPLTVIIGMASQIKENPETWLNEGVIMINRNSNRLLELINQLLALNKLESGNIYLNNKQDNIINYLKYLIESLHSYASSQNVIFHFYPEEDEVMMDFDEEKIKTIVTNLLSNAVKFSPSGGDVYLVVRKITHKGNPSLFIKFKDTGIGISKNQLPLIFDRFYQADNTSTRKGEGSGIGLALVKEMIQMMQGEISVTSKLGTETIFTIILPINNDAEIVNSDFLNNTISTDLTKVNQNYDEAVGVIKPIAKFEEDKLTLLLIEDNTDVVAYLASCLQDEYNLLVGIDGQEGIDIAITSIPDLIVTDIMMPIKDGLEVSRTLKTNPITSHIPIIILSARADINSKLEGLEYGADTYLSKPFNKEELQIRIKKLLESRQLLQNHYSSLASGGNTNQKPLKSKISIDDEFVEKLITIVENRLGDFDFSIEQFSKLMSMSTSQLHRKVTAVTTLSPSRFIRKIRLAKAKEMLQNRDLAINSIAKDVGFKDSGYFSRVFKQEFGITPLEWREAN